LQTLLNLLSSVALLIWGTHIVRTGILRVFGASLRHILATSVANRGAAFLAGLGVTALVQSSSATALIASSFVSQNLLALSSALAIMLGADIGTALIALLLSLNLAWLSPLCIFFGVTVFLSRRSTRAGQIGRVAIGLGLIILALQLAASATAPIAQAQGVRVLFSTLSGDPMLDMLIGALLTMASFSSLAVILLTASFAASHLISVPVALCLVLGSNLGSGLLALVVNLRTAGGGRRVAVGNLAFKAVGCLLFYLMLPWIDPWLSRVEPDIRREVLYFHVLFNVVIVLVFLWLTGRVARAVERLIPLAAERVPQTEPRFLDPAAISTPALALANAARETLRIGDTIEQMLGGMMEVLRTNDAKRAEEIIKLDDSIDRLYTAVKLYLTQISREDLEEADSRRWAEIISLTINFEHVGDILEHILTDLRTKKIDHRLSFSEAGMAEIAKMHDMLVANLRMGLSVFLNGDLKVAQALLAEKERFSNLERDYRDMHLTRLSGQTVQSIETSSLHLDIISDMRRINSFFCSTAYPVLERAGKLRSSRLLETTGARARPEPAAPRDEPPDGARNSI